MKKLYPLYSATIDGKSYQKSGKEYNLVNVVKWTSREEDSKEVSHKNYYFDLEDNKCRKITSSETYCKLIFENFQNHAIIDDEAIKRVVEIIDSSKPLSNWKLVEDELPPVGVPLIVTVKDHLQEKGNELRYPVYYEKNCMKEGYCWSWRYGDFAYELLPDVSEVIAFVEFLEPYKG